MKRITITLPSLPLMIGLVFTFILGMSVSTFTTQPASGAPLNTAITGTLTGCVGSTSPTGVNLDLAGRVITPSTILRLEPSGTCAAGESSVNWTTNSDLTYVKTTTTIPGLVAEEVRAYCPAGKQATSGGFIVNIDVNLGNNFRVNVSAPYSNVNGNYWSFVGENFNNPATANSTATVTVYAICQTLASGISPASLTAPDSSAPDLYNKPAKLGS